MTLEKWTVQSIWYRMLPIFQRYNVTIKRDSLIGYIKPFYDIRHITRASRRIFAGVRAELYFKGEWKSVSFDAINELAEKGTDIVFIEKQGIPELLTDYANKYGIAMVNTRGYLTEYGKDLMDAARRSGANVVIMTDYDITGINIASNTPREIPWIGIDERTFEYFNLDRNSNDIAVQATNKRLLNKVQEKVDTDTRFSNVDIEFLEKRRVEIDAISAKVGNERLFVFVLDRLKELYPKRDYNRAIELPHTDDFKVIYKDNLIGVEHEDFIAFIEARKMDTMKSELEQIKNELQEVDGFIDVEEKHKDIKTTLSDKFKKNPDYLDFVKKLNDLRSHPFFTHTQNSIDKGKPEGDDLSGSKTQ
jgi:hypothetical protein